MIQSILFFTLGFLCAGFLALMVAPAVWRRAVTLTRKRIEASVPLSLNEIQADKDRMRAEFAMSTRRLEMSIKAFKEKASSQIIEVNRNREELKRLSTEKGDKNQTISELEGKASELRAELRQREDQLHRLTGRLEDAQLALEERALELDKLGQMYDEATLSSSDRQIQLVTRESEVEKLADDISLLRTQRKEAEARAEDIAAESKSTRDALKVERKRVADLEKKVERTLGTLTDREEKLDRHEKELARLRDQLKGNSQSDHELNAQLVEAQTDKVKLEAELADLTLQMSTLLSGAKGGDVEKAIARLQDDRDRLETRLAVLMRENKKLRGDLAAIEQSKAGDWGDERRESALLREQINDLAAEVVHMTARLEGPQSTIHKALATPVAETNADPRDKITSLADRVRALQKASAAT